METLNSLYLGLRTYELSTEAKMQVTDENGDKLFTDKAAAALACMVFFQYMPFSSRVAAVIGQVTDAHAKAKRDQTQAQRDADPEGRAAAAKKVGSTKQRSSISDYNTPFDKCTYDPIRTNALRQMVGAWHVGKVLDTKAARHDPYAGGPRDTAFSCIVDVGLSWRSAVPFGEDLQEFPSDYYEQEVEEPDPEKPGEMRKVKRTRTVFGWTKDERAGQQTRTALTNAAQPALGGSDGVLGPEFGRKAAQVDYCNKGGGGGGTRSAEAAAAAAAAPEEAAPATEEAAASAAAPAAAKEAEPETPMSEGTPLTEEQAKKKGPEGPTVTPSKPWVGVGPPMASTTK